ncbi:MAG: O-antigen ligase family protein [Vampirovibrionales bacterium]|nr:O-antigen ligase family protein [Vampirovibrionales bacterium]
MGTWLGLIALMGLLAPLLVYGLLPALGIEAPAKLLDVTLLFPLTALGIGAAVYSVYFKFIMQRPVWLAIYTLCIWVLVEWLAFFLMQAVHLNLHQRPLIVAAFCVPYGWLAWRHKYAILSKLPYVGIFLGFLAWIGLYFVFFNHNTQDVRMGLEGHSIVGSSIAVMKLSAYSFIAVAVCGTAALFLSQSSGQKTLSVFDRVNRWFLVSTALYAIVAILGYPFGPKTQLFSTMLDGFLRAVGLYSHPNPFAHAEGMTLLYSTALYLYYSNRKSANPEVFDVDHPQAPSLKLLYISLALNLIAFLLGFSKTSFLAIGIAMLVMAGPQVLTRSQVIFWLKRAWIPVVLIPVAMFGYEVISGQSFADILEKRMADTLSFIWRMQSWQVLLNNITLGSMWLGHGFTSANAKLLQLYFSSKAAAKPLIQVHNGYIDLLYEFGLMGYLLFAAVGSLVWQALSLRSHNAPLSYAVLGMAAYYLFVSAFDEMTYMFNAAMLFWVLSTVCVCVVVRSKA